MELDEQKRLSIEENELKRNSVEEKIFFPCKLFKFGGSFRLQKSVRTGSSRIASTALPSGLRCPLPPPLSSPHVDSDTTRPSCPRAIRISPVPATSLSLFRPSSMWYVRGCVSLASFTLEHSVVFLCLCL